MNRHEMIVGATRVTASAKSGRYAYFFCVLCCDGLPVESLRIGDGGRVLDSRSSEAVMTRPSWGSGGHALTVSRASRPHLRRGRAEGISAGRTRP